MVETVSTVSSCDGQTSENSFDSRLTSHTPLKQGVNKSQRENYSIESLKHPIVIAIDGTSASGKSTNARLVAKALGFVYVDTGAMYRTLAWYCLKNRIDFHNAKLVASACRRWKTKLECVDGHVRLVVDGYFPEKEMRTAEVSVAVSVVATVPKVRDWMKKTQRECIQFGNLVMEGRES